VTFFVIVLVQRKNNPHVPEPNPCDRQKLPDFGIYRRSLLPKRFISSQRFEMEMAAHARG
jgi:hypothetical protein